MWSEDRTISEIAHTLRQRTGEYCDEKWVWSHVARTRDGIRKSDLRAAAGMGVVPPVEPEAAPRELTPEERAARDLEAAIADERERQRVAAEKRLLREMTQGEARFRRLIETFEGAIAAVPEVPAPALPQHRHMDEEVHMAVLISDTQVGMAVDPLEVGDRYAYDTGDFDLRWIKLESELAKLRQRVEHSGRRVGALHEWYDGDLVENSMMRPKQRLDVDMSVAMQTTYLARKVIAHLEWALGIFPEVYVDFVGGNHGRTGKPGDDKTYDSFDLMVGWMVEVAFRNNPRVHIKVWTQPYALIGLGASTILLNHGHGIKSWAGIPWYGIDRKVARWQGLFRQQFNYVMLGHFHNSAAWDANGGCEVIVNGAFFSGSGFSINDLALATPAAQWAFVFDRNEGIVERVKIKLADPKEAMPEPARNEWPASVPA